MIIQIGVRDLLSGLYSVFDALRVTETFKGNLNFIFWRKKVLDWTSGHEGALRSKGIMPRFHIINRLAIVLANLRKEGKAFLFDSRVNSDTNPCKCPVRVSQTRCPMLFAVVQSVRPFTQEKIICSIDIFYCYLLVEGSVVRLWSILPSFVHIPVLRIGRRFELSCIIIDFA